MQIITLEDSDFPALLSVLENAQRMGMYTKDGKIHMVCACAQFVIIAPGNNPEKLAIKPSRNIKEAREIALEFLNKEAGRGSSVQVFSV